MSSRADTTDKACPELPPPANLFATLAILLGLATLLFGLWTVGPAILFGLIGVWHARRTGEGKGFAFGGIAFASAGALLHVVWPLWSEFRAAYTVPAWELNRTKQVAFALRNYQDATGTLPSACYRVETGPPRDPTHALSWQVELLPYIEFDNIYRAMKLAEPWDSPTNRPLADQQNVFGDNGWGDPLTRYRVFYGNGAAFELHRAVKPEEITDGTANTVLFVQSAQQVPWPQCNELPFDPSGPLPPMGRPDRKWFLAAMADGSVRTVRKDVDPNVMKAAITRAGGEPPPDW